jgi:hypothetical protein
MSLKFGRLIHFYYFFILFILISALVSSIAYLKVVSPINIENISEVFESSLLVEQIKGRNDVNKIFRLVTQDQAREAMVVVEKLEKDVKSLAYIDSAQSQYKKINQSFSEIKKSLSSLISLPELTTIVSVLKGKVENFESFVISNNWRTLTRMSKRLKAKLNMIWHGQKKTFQFRRLRRLEKSIKKDIKIMQNVTKSSVLSKEDKDIIIKKLDRLSTELVMLGKYGTAVKNFEARNSDVLKELRTWLKIVDPEISLRILKFNKFTHLVLLSLFALGAFLVTALFFGVIIYKYSCGKSEKKIENFALNVIGDGLIPLDNRLRYKTSESFMNELENLRKYLHKRISFGSIFQESTPFAALLLDSNLNLVWGNKQFYETWNMSDLVEKNSTISWDYLQRFTNLGEQDPVIAALNDQIAGIYQIQIKTMSNADATPYEMYVSPTEYASQKRIMIFFYSLSSLEETISNQTKSLVGPVSRTLDALCKGEMTLDFKNNIKSDFDIAGISNIFSKFEAYNSYIERQKSGLMMEIERLESDLFDQHKLVDDIRNIIEEQTLLYNEAMKKFSETRDSVVSIVELRNEMEQLFQNTIVTSKNLFKDELDLITQAESLNDVIEDQVKSFESLVAIKGDFKQSKSKIDEFKTRLIHAIDHLLIFQKSSQNQSGLEDSLSRVKSEIKGFEKVLSTFGQISMSLDVSISKIDLVMNRRFGNDLGPLKEKFNKARDLIETDMFNVGKITRVGQTKDKDIVRSLKSLYDIVRGNRKQLLQMSKLIDNNQIQKTVNVTNNLDQTIDDHRDLIEKSNLLDETLISNDSQSVH